MDRKEQEEAECESVYSGVGYRKMDYPPQHAIYHCQSGEEGESQRRGDNKRD